MIGTAQQCRLMNGRDIDLHRKQKSRPSPVTLLGYAHLGIIKARSGSKAARRTRTRAVGSAFRMRISLLSASTSRVCLISTLHCADAS